MLRTYLSAVLATTLIVGSLAACGKKKKDEPAPATDTPEASAPPAPAPPPAATDVAGRYLDYVAAINERDEKRLAAAVAPDAELHLADSPDVLEGPDAVVKSNVQLWTALPDIRVEPQLVLCRGDQVAALLLAHGTQTGPMQTPAGTLAPTQAETGSYGIELATVKDGLITGGTQFWDVGLLLDQIRKAKDARAPVTRGLSAPRVVVAPVESAAQPAAAAALNQALHALGTGDLDSVTQAFADDAVLSVSALPTDITGQAAIRKQLERLRAAAPDLTIEPSQLFGTDDLAAAVATYESKRGSLEVAHVVEVKDGHITRMWVVVNGAALRALLGKK